MAENFMPPTMPLNTVLYEDYYDPNSGQTFDITYFMAIQGGYLPRDLYWNQYASEYQEAFLGQIAAVQGGYTPGSGDIPGSSGSRGAGRAPYRAPDEGQVSDYVKSYVVAVTGQANQEVIAKAMSAYMQADRANYGANGDVDPTTAMKEVVRGTTAYKAVNAGRPDFVDELDWVSERQGALLRAGVSPATAERLGIASAIGGATPQATQEAGEMAASMETGRELDTMRDKLKGAARGALSLL